MDNGRWVIDTSVWIEWLIGSETAQQFAERFPPRSQTIVPSIVQLELAKWLTRELGEDKADQVIAYTLKCQVVALDTSIALIAAEQNRRHKLATADAVVYATAVSQRAQLMTCDAHFRELPGVLYFPKQPA